MIQGVAAFPGMKDIQDQLERIFLVSPAGSIVEILQMSSFSLITCPSDVCDKKKHWKHSRWGTEVVLHTPQIKLLNNKRADHILNTAWFIWQHIKALSPLTESKAGSEGVFLNQIDKHSVGKSAQQFNLLHW